MGHEKPRTRYDMIRDYTLLGVGAMMLVSGTLGALVLASPYALGVIGGGMTALGLVPVFQREKR